MTSGAPLRQLLFGSVERHFAISRKRAAASLPNGSDGDLMEKDPFPLLSHQALVLVHRHRGPNDTRGAERRWECYLVSCRQILSIQ